MAIQAFLSSRVRNCRPLADALRDRNAKVIHESLDRTDEIPGLATNSRLVTTRNRGTTGMDRSLVSSWFVEVLTPFGFKCT